MIEALRPTFCASMAQASPVGPPPTISTSLRVSASERILVCGNVAGICAVTNECYLCGSEIQSVRVSLFNEEKDSNMRRCDAESVVIHFSSDRCACLDGPKPAHYTLNSNF